MTIEERFERIEHYTVAIAEERRKDREEYKSLWRDTQRQLNELTLKLADYAEQSRRADERLENRIEQLAAETRVADALAREADARLGVRIDALVSAIGSKLLPPQN